MKISSIQSVKVDWMEGYCNDPMLKCVVKKGAEGLIPESQFKWMQKGNLFYSEKEGEFKFFAHNKSDHSGFGGYTFDIQMSEDWNSSNWNGCDQNEPAWGNGGRGSIRRKCYLETGNHGDRILHITGPWDCGTHRVCEEVREVVSVGILTPEYNNRLRNPDRFKRDREKYGERASEGVYLGCTFTLEFAREMVDVLAPHLDLYKGDYGWYPMIRGGQPKNPRSGREKKHWKGSYFVSDAQAMVIER